jgi:hypothetical protein
VACVTPVADRRPVYNLTVAGDHEYFANGILTHNCDALRYGCMGLEAGGFGSFYRDEIAKMHAAKVAA